MHRSMARYVSCEFCDNSLQLSGLTMYMFFTSVFFMGEVRGKVYSKPYFQRVNMKKSRRGMRHSP